MRICVVGPSECDDFAWNIGVTLEETAAWVGDI